MRTEQEVIITDLVKKYHVQLIEKGAAMVQKDRRVRSGSRMDAPSGMAIFNQMLDGCLLTLSYREQGGHQLCIMDWRFSNPLNN